MNPVDLKDYPEGTRIQIGDRIFVRLNRGTNWKEEHELLGNRTTRPSYSLKSIEVLLGKTHVVLPAQPLEKQVIPDLNKAHAVALLQVLATIDANNDTQPDWVDAVCTARELLPEGTLEALAEFAGGQLDLEEMCSKAQAMVTGDFAQETLADYLSDAKNGLLTQDRLRGFLQGLSVAGALSADDFNDLDRLMTAQPFSV